MQPAGTGALVRLDAYPDFAAYMAARRGSINKLARKQRKLAVERRERASASTARRARRRARLAARPRGRLPRPLSRRRVTPAFLRSLVRHGLPSGVVHCSALELDGKPFSWHLGFHLNRVHYDYICGFDPTTPGCRRG